MVSNDTVNATGQNYDFHAGIKAVFFVKRQN